MSFSSVSADAISLKSRGNYKRTSRSPHEPTSLSIHAASPMFSQMCIVDYSCSELRSVPQPRIRSCPFSRSHNSSSFSTAVFLSPHNYFNPEQRKKKPAALLLLLAKTENVYARCLQFSPSRSGLPSHCLTLALVKVASDLDVARFCSQFSGVTMSILS